MEEKIKIKTKYNLEADAINLELSASENLRKILKECTIEEQTPCTLEDGNTCSLIRYRVKRIVCGNLNLSTLSANLLFSVDLLDGGKVNVDVTSTEQLRRVIDRLKRDLALVLPAYYEGVKEKEVNISVNINLPQ